MPNYDTYPIKDPDGKPNQGIRDAAVRKIWNLVAQAEEATETLLAITDRTPSEEKALVASKELTKQIVADALSRHDAPLSTFFSDKASLHDGAKSVEEELGDRVARLEREFKTDPVLKLQRATKEQEEQDRDARTETLRLEVKGFEIDENGNVTYHGPTKELKDKE